MINYQINGLLVLWLSIGLLLGYRAYLLDAYRFELLSIRDDAWMLALRKGWLKDPTHLGFRARLNSSILWADRVNTGELLPFVLMDSLMSSDTSDLANASRSPAWAPYLARYEVVASWYYRWRTPLIYLISNIKARRANHHAGRKEVVARVDVVFHKWHVTRSATLANVG